MLHDPMLIFSKSHKKSLIYHKKSLTEAHVIREKIVSKSDGEKA